MGAAAGVLRWVAHVWAIVTIALVVAFSIGEGIELTTLWEWIGFVFFPVGVCAGMIVAWRSEILGGAITVGSLVVFYAIHYVSSGAFPQGFAWLVFAAPGFLFLAAAYLSRRAMLLAA